MAKRQASFYLEDLVLEEMDKRDLNRSRFANRTLRRELGI